MNDLESRGLSNDTLSSVRVPFGYKVTLFNDIDYGGNAVVLLADSVGLGDFNDETTSIKVEKLTYGNFKDGEYCLTAIVSNKVVCAENSGNDPLIANKDSNGGAWEVFWITSMQ